MLGKRFRTAVAKEPNSLSALFERLPCPQMMIPVFTMTTFSKELLIIFRRAIKSNHLFGLTLLHKENYSNLAQHFN